MIYNMEGSLKEVLSEITGEKNNKKWNKKDFVIVDETNKDVCLTLWGANISKILGIKIGSNLSIDFNITASEYPKGSKKWFTNLTAIEIREIKDENDDKNIKSNYDYVNEFEKDKKIDNNYFTEEPDDLPF